MVVVSFGAIQGVDIDFQESNYHRISHLGKVQLLRSLHINRMSNSFKDPCIPLGQLKVRVDLCVAGD